MLVGIGACGLAQLAFAVAWTAAPETAAAGRAVVAFICLCESTWASSELMILIVCSHLLLCGLCPLRLAHR
jgi:hypothetical protein